ncbi:hypothetical protein ALE3EI_2330 [Constantimarinum furrinae]|uniref:Uncharacterized protein n=1 Tax=Constantimarinum furrinae TaxID=2562285 RepID=A0A7G8PX05_9FLAO|nr:hypothetical protein ALE3EI_2330 [Constantimarinum furrinae]
MGAELFMEHCSVRKRSFNLSEKTKHFENQKKKLNFATLLANKQVLRGTEKNKTNPSVGSS